MPCWVVSRGALLGRHLVRLAAGAALHPLVAILGRLV